ncbi:MAG: EFR1 family ferrodoxin [Anaerotignaceae bacterium]
MIFYFTGTGNSLFVAKEMDSDIYSVPQILNSENISFKADTIGIVCPVYGHEMPAMVKDFILKASLHTDYLYLILTYGKRHGNAVELAEEIFLKSNKKVNYITTLLMVDNFLPVFDMSEEIKLDKGIDSQIKRIKSDVENRVQKIEAVTALDRMAHNSYLKKVSYASETIWANFVVTDKCVGCGICTKVCPAGCIFLEKQLAIYNKDKCQACFACIHACPKMAIQMNIHEKNPRARYRNPHISISEIVKANNQMEKY